MKLQWCYKIRKQCLVIATLLALAATGFNWSVGSYLLLPTGHLFFSPAPNVSTTKLEDVLFTAKTTRRNHQKRLDIILATWYQDISSDQIFFVSDQADLQYQIKTNFRMVSTPCNADHSRYSLCCKTGVELDLYLSSSKKRRWWCHVDDDNYVNVPRLLEILNHYRWQDPVYVGRRSVPVRKHWKFGNFLYATGGAGYCITRSLADKMAPLCGNGTFVKACQLIDDNDDCTFGFVVTNQLKVSLSESMALHSHLEKLGLLNVSNILQAGTMGYNHKKMIDLPPARMTFSKEKDHSRMLSLHCWLHPHLEMCQRLAEGLAI